MPKLMIDLTPSAEKNSVTLSRKWSWIEKDSTRGRRKISGPSSRDLSAAEAVTISRSWRNANGKLRPKIAVSTHRKELQRRNPVLPAITEGRIIFSCSSRRMR